MPEDKPYIQKIYNFLNSSYGANGQLSPGAFTLGFDDFYNKITTNDKYANKIYSALNTAYGPTGKLKAGAFTLDEGTFKSKVMSPVSPAPVGVLAPVNTAQPKYYETQPVATATTEDPALSVMKSASDIPQEMFLDKDGQFKTHKSPGVMSDISAFDPILAAKEESDQEAVKKFNQSVFNVTPKIDPLTQKELPLSDFQFQMRNKLKEWDEIDKNLHEQQQKADEFYKTTAGGLYYSFVRPIYKTMLNAGKNTSALTLRAAGELGASLGLDESKEILDKTADGLVDYFDFNRLARQGNSSGYLNLEPTAQQGALNKKNILPRAMEAISSMAALMGGARAAGGGTSGLFASSYAITFEDYRKRAKDAGLNNEEADRFATISAGVTSALEMISPNRFLLGGEGLAKQSIFSAIKNGVPVKEAVKQGARTAFKEIGRENIQEFSQNVADKVIRGGTDLVTNQNRFNEDGILPSFQENLETAILTTIATGVMSARHITHNASPSSIERSAWSQAADNIESFTQTVKGAIQEGQIDPHAGRRMIERVGEYKELYDALQDHAYSADKAANIAIEGIKSKRIQERSKPLSGLKSLQNLATQDEQSQSEIEAKISDIENDIPEVGTELSSTEVKDLLTQVGGQDKIDMVSDNGYKVTQIDLNDLYNENEEFKKYVDDGKLRPSANKNSLKVPAIVNMDGRVVDGMNRLAQLYVDGANKVNALKEMYRPDVSIIQSINPPRIVPIQGERSNVSVTRPNTPNIVEIQPKLSEDAIQVESPTKIPVRNETGNSEEVGQGNAELQNISGEGEVRNEASPQEEIESKIQKPQSIEEAKQRRDDAINRLKEVYNSINTTDNTADRNLLPVDEMQVRDRALYDAIKEELSFRGNRIESMPDDIRESVKERTYKEISNTIPIQKEVFDRVFDQVYADQRNPLDAEKRTVESLFDGTKTSAEIVQRLSDLAEDKFLSDRVRELVPYLQQNPEIKFSKLFTTAVGEAFPTGDWTVLPANAKNKKILSYAVIHELYHAISLNELMNNESFNEKISDLVYKLREQLNLKTYFDGVSSIEYGAKKNMKYYGLINSAEFIAEIFSNKSFSELIDKTDLGEKKPILTRVIDYIKSALGIKSSSSTNSDKIRKMILSSIDNKINFDRSGKYDVEIKNMRENAREGDFKFTPQAENKWADKTSRDKAIDRLKEAYNNLGNLGFAFDPKQAAQRQVAFDKALVNYIKEEILYRVNVVKGFAKYKKGQIRTAISRAMRAEGIKPDVEVFNKAFEEAYKNIKSIPGVLGKNLDRISFKEYIKSKIKAREKGRKEGLKEGITTAKQRVYDVKKGISEAIKGTGIKLSIQQLRRITELLQQSITAKDTQKSIDHAVDVATQMVWESKNKQKINTARGLIKKIRSMKRSASMVISDIEWINQLDLPSPNKVDDVDTYVNMLDDYLKSRKGNEDSPTYTKEDIADFIQNENDRIYREKRLSQQQELDELISKGLMPSDVTLDEYIALLDNESPAKVSEGLSKKAEQLKDFIRPKAADFRRRLRDMEQPGNVDPLFDLMSTAQRDVVKRLAEIDVADLKTEDLVKLNNVLNNIAEDGTVDGAGQLITSYEAAQDVKDLVESEDKIRQLPSVGVLSKKNISNFSAALFYNDNAISRFRSKTIGPIERKLSPAFKKTQRVVQQFVALNKKHKIDAQSNARLHAFSYINQYKGIEKGEISDALNTKVEELIDDAEYVYSEGVRMSGRRGGQMLRESQQRLDALKSLGLIDYHIQDGQLKIDRTERFDSENPERAVKEVYKKLSFGEKAVYNYVKDHYASIASDLEFVTRTYANKEFVRERNYVSQVAKKKSGESFNDSELSDNTDILVDRRSVNSKPAGTTMTRSDRKPASVYYDGDFFSNFVNRYYQSLYTIEVLPELQRVAKVANDKQFADFVNGALDEGFKGERGYNYLQFKKKLAQAINEGKYSPFFKRENQGRFDKIASNIIGTGVKLALNNIWQGPKQFAPAIVHNFAIAHPKAVSFAIGTGLKSLIDKSYGEDRAKFLSNFTGVKRAALGSEAYDTYIKRFKDNPGWWTKTTEVSDRLAKLSAFSLERGDRAAQNTAYISGYITSLLNQGKIKHISEFDFAKEAENPNKEALAFAEQIASAINNESAREYKPDVLKDSDKARLLWLLQGFSLNAYQNAMNKIKIISDNRSTGEERQEAALHFVGYLGEMATYQMVGKTARGLQYSIAAALLGTLLSQFGIRLKDEDEEAKRNRKKKESIRTASNIGADIALSGLSAPYQITAKELFNMGYKEWAKHEVSLKKKEAKAKGEKFDPKGTYLSPYFVPFYGADGPGGGAEFFFANGKAALKVIGDQLGWSAEEEKKKSEEDKEIEAIAKKLNVSMMAAAAILRSGDLALLNNKMQQQIKNATKDAHKPASAAAGGHRRTRTRRRTANNR